MLVLDGAQYTYPGSERAAVCPVSISVLPGQRWWWAGPSGCGKSTLLRMAAGLTGRHGSGSLCGRVAMGDRDPAGMAPADRARLVAYVAQDPSDTFVTGTVADEVAFAPESLGWSSDRIHEVVAQSLMRSGLHVDWDSDPRTLSGGQQQRLAVAAALAGGARLLLLDEPLARLDAQGADELLHLLRGLAEEGVAVVVAEHRTTPMIEFCTHTLLLDGSTATSVEGAPSAVALRGAGLGREWPQRETPQPGPVVRHVKRDAVAYGPVVVLRDVDVEVRAGERVALLGPNGVGKSTLLGALSGRLDEGRVEGIQEVRQDADLSLFSDTVRAELAYGPLEQGVSAQDVDRRVGELARRLRLEHKLDEPPQALSSGERLRLAVGAALATQPKILLLDEPTAGQDGAAVRGLLGALDAAPSGTAVVWATHDLDLARRCADRIIAVPELAHERVCAVEPVSAAGRPVTRPGLDPRVRLVLLVTVGVCAVLLNRPFSLGMLTVVSAMALMMQPIGNVWRVRALGIALATAWAMCLSQGIFYADYPRTPVLSVGPVQIWAEGLEHGLIQSLRLIASAFAGFTLALSTPSDRLVRGLGALKVPWTVALLAATALRFAPQVGSEWLQVRAARSARGRSVWMRSPMAWLQLELSLLRPVVARSLRRGRAMAASLDTRGFDVDARRSERIPLQLNFVDRTAGAVALALMLAVLVLTGLVQLYLAEALYVPELRSVYGWVRIWL